MAGGHMASEQVVGCKMQLCIWRQVGKREEARSFSLHPVLCLFGSWWQTWQASYGIRWFENLASELTLRIQIYRRVCFNFFFVLVSRLASLGG